MIEKILGELYWDELGGHIDAFASLVRNIPVNNLEVVVTSMDQDVFSMFIFGRMCFAETSKNDLNLAAWAIQSRDCLNKDITDSLLKNLPAVKNRMIMALMHPFAENIDGNEVTLKSIASTGVINRFNYLNSLSNLEDIWKEFKEPVKYLEGNK